MSDHYDRNGHYLEDTGEVDENGNHIYIEHDVEPESRTGSYGIGYWLGQKAKEHPLAALIIAIIAGIIIFACLNNK